MAAQRALFPSSRMQQKLTSACHAPLPAHPAVPMQPCQQPGPCLQSLGCTAAQIFHQYSPAKSMT